VLKHITSSEGGERVSTLRRELQETMDFNAQVYRTEATLKQALSDVQQLRRRYRTISVQDKGKRFNTDLLETLRSALEARLAVLDLHSAALAAHRDLELAAGRPLTPPGGVR